MKKLAKEFPERARKNFKTYKPMVDALKKYGRLTPRRLSEVTEITEKKAGEFLEIFLKMDLLGKEGETYIMSLENEKEISNLFCLSDK
jgi:hypothetical protein